MGAIKSRDEDHKIKAGDIMVVTCGGPLGTGMEEVYQLTAALKFLSYGKQVALITDARFSGVSTGACIGHVGPEALAGGPIGRVRDGDVIEIVVDRNNLSGSVNLVGIEARGLYRPAADCVMFTRDEVGFCPVCAAAIERIIDLHSH